LLELNRSKLLNKINNNYYYCLFNITDIIDDKTDFSIKIENIFVISFKALYFSLNDNKNKSCIIPVNLGKVIIQDLNYDNYYGEENDIIFLFYISI
jgi:hypothetical protein